MYAPLSNNTLSNKNRPSCLIPKESSASSRMIVFKFLFDFYQWWDTQKYSLGLTIILSGSQSMYADYLAIILIDFARYLFFIKIRKHYHSNGCAIIDIEVLPNDNAALSFSVTQSYHYWGNIIIIVHDMLILNMIE